MALGNGFAQGAGVRTSRVDPCFYFLPPFSLLLKRAGGGERTEVYIVFHVGVGVIPMVGPKEADGVIASLRVRGEGAWIMGIMEEGEGGA